MIEWTVLHHLCQSNSAIDIIYPLTLRDLGQRNIGLLDIIYPQGCSLLLV